MWLCPRNINASGTKYLLSQNEEWHTSTHESWGTLQGTLLQDIRAHISIDIDANLVALRGETECIQRLSAQLCVNRCKYKLCHILQATYMRRTGTFLFLVLSHCISPRHILCNSWSAHVTSSRCETHQSTSWRLLYTNEVECLM